jgi:hypothetical protein
MSVTDIDVKRNTVPEQWAGETWETATAGAYTAFGADLEKGEMLIGVPFLLVKATFRPGDYLNSVTGTKGAYVSLDAIIAPQRDLDKALARKRITAEQHASLDPGEQIIFNEGGTGVYRQIVKFLHDTGRITFASDLPEGGAYGESCLDTPIGEWDVDQSAEFRRDDDERPTVAFSIRLLCPRGLRSSEYENEATKTGLTRYIA